MSTQDKLFLACQCKRASATRIASCVCAYIMSSDLYKTYVVALLYLVLES